MTTFQSSFIVNFYIGNFKQYGVIHYVEDTFLTDKIVTNLEKANEAVYTV